MTDEIKVEELTDDEAANLKDEDYAELEVVDDADVGTLGLTAGCSSGHGKCSGGKCYVCCSGRWYKLINRRNGSHYSCSAGRRKPYKCGSNRYYATC